MNLVKNIEQIKNGNIEQQISSLTEVHEHVVRFISDALQQLPKSDNPILLAEKIFEFGTLALPQVEAAFANERAGSIKEVLAVLLVQLGSNKGNDLLLEIARRKGPNQLLAVMSLAKANLNGAAEVIIEALRNCAPDCYRKRENAPFIQTFLVALKQLGHPLPQDLKTKFGEEGVPSELHKAL